MIQEAREPIQIRLRDSERRVLTSAAQHVGITRSQLIRRAALDRALEILQPLVVDGSTPSPNRGKAPDTPASSRPPDPPTPSRERTS